MGPTELQFLTSQGHQRYSETGMELNKGNCTQTSTAQHTTFSNQSSQRVSQQTARSISFSKSHYRTQSHALYGCEKMSLSECVYGNTRRTDIYPDFIRVSSSNQQLVLAPSEIYVQNMPIAQEIKSLKRKVEDIEHYPSQTLSGISLLVAFQEMQQKIERLEARIVELEKTNMEAFL
jgi:hypothetical protein